MSTVNLEQRVAALEIRFSELLTMLRGRPSVGAWRNVVGMFANDPLIEEHHRETLRIRDEDRKVSRDASET